MAGGKGNAEVLTRFGLAVASLVPPAVLGARFWSSVSAHPVVSLLLFLGYGALLAGLGFLAKVYGKVADRWVERAADAVDRRLRWRLSRFERDYRAYVLSHHRFIDLKGLATRGDYTPGLEEVFVDVSLVPRPAHEASRESLAGALPGGADGELRVRQSVRDFLGKPEGAALAVIGAPGTGKTTLLKHLALGLARERGGRDLPVLLLLRDHAETIGARPDVSLPEIIGASLRRLKGDEPPGWFDRRLQEGRCVVLLDGLDEVAREEDRRHVSKWVEEQIEQYEGNDFVLTSRPHGYASAPVNRARVLQVRRFTGEQIRRFVHGWYRAIERLSTGTDAAAVTDRAEEGAEDLLARLRARPVLYDLAANPLLLTMIANVHRYRGALPGSRAELYGEICEVLLWRRQEAKGGVAASRDELTGAKKEVLLRELAFVMMADRMRDIRGEYASEVLRPLLFRVSSILSSQEFLDAIVVSGLLIERERGLYSFAHLTLQEHLAALHIQHRGRADVLAANVDDDWWRETTLLYAARVDPAPVVGACLASETVRALALAFDCEEEATELDVSMTRRLESLRGEALREPVGSSRRRLMTAVTVMRWLRDTVRLGEDTLVCARPVTREIFGLFAAEKFPPTGRGLVEGPPEAAAVGMTREQAGAFVRWLNGLLPEDVGYRLPTEAEVADPGFRLAAPAPEHTIWYAPSDGDPVGVPLWVPEGAGNPWWPGPADLSGLVYEVSGFAELRFSRSGSWLGRSEQDDEILDLGKQALALVRDLAVEAGVIPSPDGSRRTSRAAVAASGSSPVWNRVEYPLRVLTVALACDALRPMFQAGATFEARQAVLPALEDAARGAGDLLYPALVPELDDLGPSVHVTHPGILDRLSRQGHWAMRLAAFLLVLAGQQRGSRRGTVRSDGFQSLVHGVLSGVDFTASRVRPLMPEALAVLASDAAAVVSTRSREHTVFSGTMEEMAARIVAATDDHAAARRSITASEAAFLRLEALALSEVAGHVLQDASLAGTYRNIAVGLLVLERRAEGSIVPNETIVLVRA
ncbi:NACHT domain-containing protein [Streptomyces iranensis]|uniref:Energy-coupling factor transporter ATP-binding protein EcfA2 n=1 Tax=Streptomyces iranensis TaxID=576784 RepID=A0A060ZVU0_9ACTN|nr:NACHT domain-containing protein [Streptomyces iranensis]MBP2065105.1 energy-coupling factor transporter ATP-binding protein EcfA2 [Streptomyces iranensis]CDR09946.1 large ATP-binding protein [Streptomyces iranensis]